MKFKCICQYDLLDPDVEEELEANLGRVFVWLRHNETIERARAKGQAWGQIIRRKLKELALLGFEYDVADGYDFAEIFILQTEAALLKCKEEGPTCRLLRSLGWSREVAEQFTQSTIEAMQTNPEGREEESMNSLAKPNGREVDVLKWIWYD